MRAPSQKGRSGAHIFAPAMDAAKPVNDAGGNGVGAINVVR
jgi:hypothetical protein